MAHLGNSWNKHEALESGRVQIIHNVKYLSVYNIILNENYKFWIKMFNSVTTYARKQMLTDIKSHDNENYAAFFRLVYKTRIIKITIV